MKYLHELNDNELRKVFDRNDKLQEAVYDRMYDNANYWVTEKLDCWSRGAIDYCIGYDRGAYLRCTDRALFVSGIERLQDEYCFLSDKYNDTIVYTEKLLDRLDVISVWDDKNYERIVVRIDELIEELEDACFRQFMSEYECCFETENQLNYFLNYGIEDVLPVGNYYVDDNYILYENVAYTRCYA